jgi:riboflavin-specific deaminase-like protein
MSAAARQPKPRAEDVLAIPFPRRAPKNRPHILANFALSWDARISTRKKTPSVFSSPLDKRRLLAIRAVGDAVLAGHGTVSADNMSMGLPDAALRAARRTRSQDEFPLRVILSNSGRIRADLKVFQHDFSPIVIFSTTAMPKASRRAVEKKAQLHLFDAETVDLPAALQLLRRDYAIKSLVCEGGAGVFRSLLAHHALDELYLTLCPLIFGGQAAPTLTGPAGAFLPHSIRARLITMQTVAGECFLRYRLTQR